MKAYRGTVLRLVSSLATTLVVVLLVGVVMARAQTPIGGCGLTFTDGVLVNDVDCSGNPYGLTILHGGSLDLAGFTITGGDGSAVTCEQDCSVTGPGTITEAGYNGIASLDGRVTANGVTFTLNHGAALAGKHVFAQSCTFEFNGQGIHGRRRTSATTCQFLHNRTGIGGIDFTRIDVTDSSFIENEFAIASGGRVTLKGSTVVDSQNAGVLCRNIKASDSTVTGNGAGGFCNEACVDLGTYRLKAKGVTCDTSAVYTWPEFNPTGGTWGLCSQD
jgi:hypothetical protein